MQDLDPGLYEAKWGAYRMVACIREPKRSCGELIVIHDDETETSVLQCIDTDAPGLIKAFAEYLEQHGVVAIVGGQRVDLADFLVFEPVTPTVH